MLAATPREGGLNATKQIAGNVAILITNGYRSARHRRGSITILRAPPREGGINNHGLSASITDHTPPNLPPLLIPRVTTKDDGSLCPGLRFHVDRHTSPALLVNFDRASSR